VKIMDFGIARVRGAEHMTTDGYMMGTPAYMSPEQVLCQDVDGRSDLYSVGVMFYRLLTGSCHSKPTRRSAWCRSRSPTRRPGRLHRADLPAWAVAIVDRALAKSPADRYQTAEELRKALLDAIHDAAVEAKTLVLPSRRRARAMGRCAGPRSRTRETSIAAAPPRPAPTEFVVVPRRVAPAATPWSDPESDAVGNSIAAKARPRGRTGSPRHTHRSLCLSLERADRAGPRRAPPLPWSPSPLSSIVIVAWRRSQTPAPTPSASAETAVSSPARRHPAATADTTPAPGLRKPPRRQRPRRSPAVDAGGRHRSPHKQRHAPGTTLPPAGTRHLARHAEPLRHRRNRHAPRRRRQSATACRRRHDSTEAGGRAGPIPREDPRQRGRQVARAGRDVRLAEGQVTVTGPDRAIVGALPYEAVLSVIYSKSKQPLWDGPAGATPIQQVDGGAFGFLKGGRHWVSLRTKERFIVLRVEENQVASVLSLIEERTGKTTVRVAEPKGNP
jgi:hypothetical protein